MWEGRRTCKVLRDSGGGYDRCASHSPTGAFPQLGAVLDLYTQNDTVILMTIKQGCKFLLRLPLGEVEGSRPMPGVSLDFPGVCLQRTS